MVKEDKELWMKKMRESLKDYSEPLPQDGWQRLDNTLPSSKTAPKISIYGWMSVAAVIALFITAVTFLFITNDLDEKVMQLPAPIARIENEDDKTESESLANTSSQVIKKQNIEAFIRANIDSDPKTFQLEEEVTEFKNKNEVENEKFADEILTQFRKDAENDIKNDDVKTFGFGLPLPPKNKNQEIVKVKTDSILKIYGISLKNLGCTIIPELTKATEEYEKITEVYLTKRNGKGWRIKMENEIRKINKNYR